MKTVITTCLLTAFGLICFGLIWSVGPDDTRAESSNEKTTMSVDIKLFTFKPKSLEVPVGSTVVWTNGDAIDHTVTGGTPERLGGAFDSDFFNKGETFSFTFSRAGDYPYFCKRHDFMRGTIKVVPAP